MLFDDPSSDVPLIDSDDLGDKDELEIKSAPYTVEQYRRLTVSIEV